VSVSYYTVCVLLCSERTTLRDVSGIEMKFVSRMTVHVFLTLHCIAFSTYLTQPLRKKRASIIHAKARHGHVVGGLSYLCRNLGTMMANTRYNEYPSEQHAETDKLA
jgi:hypothetical protein